MLTSIGAREHMYDSSFTIPMFPQDSTKVQSKHISPSHRNKKKRKEKKKQPVNIPKRRETTWVE